MFSYQNGSWVRIILALGTNHLNFGYESSGYETSMGTKRPDSRLPLTGVELFAVQKIEPQNYLG